MKTLIISINSKYIHSSLSSWYLKNSCNNPLNEIKVMEFTINENPEVILSSVYSEKADIIAFSCYIWNITLILNIAVNLKKVSPGLKIIFGGPEVSYDSSEIMEDYSFIDYIIYGEGEQSFKALLEALYRFEPDFSKIDGLVWRSNNKTIINKPAPLIEDLDSISSPYSSEMLSSIGSRIVYFEASRGCPFSCSYCLSSTIEGVRYFSLERVKSELSKLINFGVNQIKFVDRTFNSNLKRAKEIIAFILDTTKNLRQKPNFHFEIGADLFDEELFNLLEEAPAGLFQFEIGVQTTNLVTLKIIDRKTDLNKVFSNVKRLKEMGNIHLHLDLIAGLPEEDLVSFKNSFNQIFDLKPDQLQLGFLKMLKGSKIRFEANKYNYEFRKNPTYEVLKHDLLSFEDIILLKGVEEILDRYYNSGRFKKTIEYLVNYFNGTSFDVFEALYLYYKKCGILYKSHSARDLYTILLEFWKSISLNNHSLLNDLMKLDYLASDRSNNLPDNIERTNYPGFKELCFEFLKDKSNIEKYLPGFIDVSPKNIYKEVHFEIFDYFNPDCNIKEGCLKTRQVLIFDYSVKNKVTGLYNYFIVPVALEQEA